MAASGASVVPGPWGGQRICGGRQMDAVPSRANPQFSLRSYELNYDRPKCTRLCAHARHATRSSSPTTQPTDAVKARAREDQQRQDLGTTWL